MKLLITMVNAMETDATMVHALKDAWKRAGHSSVHHHCMKPCSPHNAIHQLTSTHNFRPRWCLDWSLTLKGGMFLKNSVGAMMALLLVTMGGNFAVSLCYLWNELMLVILQATLHSLLWRCRGHIDRSAGGLSVSR